MKLMSAQCPPDLSKASSKALYQIILTARQPNQLLADCLSRLLRRTFQSPQHIDFLLHRLDWFAAPFTHYHPLLRKLTRICVGQSKHTAKVTYNLLIQALTRNHSQPMALDLLSGLFEQTYDKPLVLTCLRENYPHKLCPLDMHTNYLNSLISLCVAFKGYRSDFLQLIVQNLVNFDTELLAADEWVHHAFPEDHKIVKLRQNSKKNELATKFDTLLAQLLKYLSQIKDQKILSQVLLVFQKRILPIKTTKAMQLLVFAVVQASRAAASTFTSFLLSNIFESKPQENHYRIFNQSNFYLFSYLFRSKRLSAQAVARTIDLIVTRLKSKLQPLAKTVIDHNTQMTQLFYQNESLLVILQTLLMIVANNPQAAFKRQQYDSLLQQSKQKLHFEYFIRGQVLIKAGVPHKDNQKGLQVKFSNKFLPATLPLIAQLIDPMMRLVQSIQGEKQSQQVLQALQGRCRKLHKGQTPISHCSQTK